ncbi:hypothetical protein Glove_33g277 [Diversispora epigaea]|uniref:Uncharacterized protein n=1 Tax=Diversispora epigaea TaxID=1348612 RepID=A0A397JGW3_9GLOM|nr:hypothetical protein Glove_33g277 [Diversispora epigaea]
MRFFGLLNILKVKVNKESTLGSFKRNRDTKRCYKGSLSNISSQQQQQQQH